MRFGAELELELVEYSSYLSSTSSPGSSGVPGFSMMTSVTSGSSSGISSMTGSVGRSPSSRMSDEASSGLDSGSGVEAGGISQGGAGLGCSGAAAATTVDAVQLLSLASDDLDILLLLCSGVRERLWTRFRTPLMMGGLLLLLLESTVSAAAAASCGPRSMPDIVGTAGALDVEGFGDSTRVTGDLTSWA